MNEGFFDGSLDGLTEGINEILGTCEVAIVGDKDGIALGRYNSVGLCDGDIDEVGVAVSDMAKVIVSVPTNLDASLSVSSSILNPYHPLKMVPLPKRS